MTLHRLLLIAFLPLCLAGCSAGPSPAARASFSLPATHELPVAAHASAHLHRPFWFEANIGQYPSPVRFLYRGAHETVQLHSDGVELRWRPGDRPANGDGHAATRALRLRFVGADAAATLSGTAPLQASANYFIGNDARYWRRNIPLYGSVEARIRPGIDVRYYDHDGRLEFDLILAEGVDPGLVQITLDSDTPRHIDARGDLVIEDADGRITLHAPTIYQQGARGRDAVVGRYIQGADRRIALALGDYDRQRPLVIDPELSFASYLGGSNRDDAYAVATDAEGGVYLAAYTTSPDLPLLNPYQGAMSGIASAYVAKFVPSGTGLALRYATYVGDDVAEVRGIGVDGQGNAYVTGSTSSTVFPLVNPMQDHYAGAIDGYVFKLNPTGDALAYSTYFGGSSVDRGRGIAVDLAGAAYVCGATASTDFPSAGQGQRPFAGVVDAFALKLAPDGRTLSYSTLVGGSGGDYASAVVPDADGNAYITGHSDSNNFPVWNALQTSLAGGVDAVLVKVDGQGAISAATYLGGSADDNGFAVDVDAGGYPYVGGQTGSNNFPIGGPGATGRSSATDGFVVKLDPGMTRVLYARFLGGSAGDLVRGLKAAGNGIVHLAGITRSTNLPQVAQLQPALGGGIDAFVATLSTTSDTLLFSSYLGGAGADNAYAIALDRDLGLYLAGATDSVNFPLQHAYQAVNRGATDAFLARIALDSDADGLTNDQEAALGTDPYLADSDGDGLWDGDEVNDYATNPLLADTDGDGLADGQEVTVYHTDPLSSNQGDLAPLNAADGVVGVADLLVLSRFVMGLDSPGARDRILGDMNDDGVLNVRDMLLLGHRIGY